MSKKISRRDVLQYSGTSITGLAILSDQTVALRDDPETKPTGSDHEIPGDLAIHNNSTGTTTVTVTAFPKHTDGPVLTGSYTLPGLNAPGIEKAVDARIKKRLDVSGDGMYTFQFQLPDGSTANTDVTVTEDGVYAPQLMTVHVTPSGDITAGTMIE